VNWFQQMEAIREAADEEGAFYEVALIPLPPELEALPDIEAFATMLNFGNRYWIQIRGKSFDIDGFPMILHAGYPVNEGEWRVTDIQSGYMLVGDDDPALGIARATDLVRKYGVEWTQQRIAEVCKEMPPMPMTQGSE